MGFYRYEPLNFVHRMRKFSNLRQKVYDFLARFESTYRLLLYLRSEETQKPSNVEWMNSTLKSSKELEEMETILRDSGLPPHPDMPKNWDSLAALDLILEETCKEAKIFDAGGAKYSPIIEWLYLFGYRNLWVGNITFDNSFNRGPIKYEYQNCMDTSYPDEKFDVVTCLSVIEHGVDVKEFLNETYRILKPGGLAVISTDYWESGIDTSSKKAYGTEIKVFDRTEIEDILNFASDIGFKIGSIDMDCNEKAVKWDRKNLEFTFLCFNLRKPER